jgi:hypothetical protein
MRFFPDWANVSLREIIADLAHFWSLASSVTHTEYMITFVTVRRHSDLGRDEACQ